MGFEIANRVLLLVALLIVVISAFGTWILLYNLDIQPANVTKDAATGGQVSFQIIAPPAETVAAEEDVLNVTNE